VSAAAPTTSRLRPADLLALTKPRITAMAVIMAALATWIAPGTVGAWTAIGAILGIGLVVGAANALNMVLERDVDGLMERTRERPLPAGRMRTGVALAVGLTLSVLSLALLAAVAPLPAWLSAVALVNYVLIYTPLKRHTSWAVAIGAISGAMPVLCGWTTVTGRLDAAGLVLFAVFVVWQVPHFLAISIYRQEECDRAGIVVVPSVLGRGIAKAQTIATTTALVPLSLALVPLTGAGWTYVVVAVAVNAWFLGLAVRGLRVPCDLAWARRFFFASLVYAPALVVALLVDGVVR